MIVMYFLTYEIYYSIIFFLISIIPHLIIHLNYLKIRENFNISLSNSENLLRVEKFNEETIEIDYTKIVKVESFLSSPHFDGRLYWFPWDVYNYTVIYTEKEFYIITSFDLDCKKVFFPESIPHKYKKRFYPIILKRNK